MKNRKRVWVPLLVLLLVAACMVVGVSLAVRSYDRSLASSEAQVLCATLQTTVSDELRYSGTLFYDQTGRLTGFFSQEHGGEDAKDGFQTDENGQILLGGTMMFMMISVTSSFTPGMELNS